MRQTKRGGWSYSQPPNVQFEINRASPQAKGLVAWWPTLASRGALTLRDLVGGATGTLAGGIPWIIDPTLGWVLDFQGGADIVNVSGGPEVGTAVAGEGHSIAFWFRPTVVDPVNKGVMGLFTATNGFAFEKINLSVDYRMKTNWGAFNLSAGAIVNGQLHHIVLTWRNNPDLRQVYVNGLLDVSGVAGVGGAASTLTAIGSTAVDGTFAEVGDFRVYDGIVPAATAWQMYNRPTRWELCKPLIRRFLGWSPAPPPVGGHMTLWGRYWGP